MYLDRITINANQYPAPESVEGIMPAPYSYFYPKQRKLRRQWQRTHERLAQADRWGEYAFAAVKSALANDDLRSEGFFAILRHFKEARSLIARQMGHDRRFTNILSRKPYRFGVTRERGIATSFFENPDHPNPYHSACVLFHGLEPQLGEPINELNLFVGLQFSEMQNYILPFDPVLGLIGTVTRFVDKSGEVMYDLNHFSHSSIEAALAIVAKQYDCILKTKYGSDEFDQLILDIAKCYRYLCIICESEAGSSAIAQWTIQYLCLAKGLPLFNLTRAFEHDVDFSAYFLKEDVFVQSILSYAYAIQIHEQWERAQFCEVFFAEVTGQCNPGELEDFCRSIDSASDLNYDLLLREVEAVRVVVTPCCPFSCFGLFRVEAYARYDLSAVDFSLANVSHDAESEAASHLKQA